MHCETSTIRLIAITSLKDDGSVQERKLLMKVYIYLYKLGVQ